MPYSCVKQHPPIVRDAVVLADRNSKTLFVPVSSGRLSLEHPGVICRRTLLARGVHAYLAQATARSRAHWSKGWDGTALLMLGLDTRRRKEKGKSRQGRLGKEYLGEH
jgi:hypothetical protein